jgi:LEA14-like dessication related protein
MKTWIVLPLLLMSCVGCSALNLQKPTATVTGMTVQNVTAAGFTMNFGVDLANPNSIELPLTTADYKIGLGGVGVADGKAKPAGSIPAKGTESVTLPVTLTYENLLTAEQAIAKTGGNVPYTLDGGLSFATKNPITGDLRVPVQYSGTLALKEILNNPQAVMQSPAAQKLVRDLATSFFNH